MRDKSITSEIGTLEYVTEYRDKWLPGVEIVSEIPDGWHVIADALTAPIGAKWIGCGSFFGHNHQHALLFVGI